MVSKCVTPWKLSSNQYLLHCASGSGVSVGDLIISEQCDFSIRIHLLLHNAGLRVHTVYWCTQSAYHVLQCIVHDIVWPMD